MTMIIRDEFLSEEDLDLKTLSDEELDAVWTKWLKQAQSTNEKDARTYSHGVFVCEPPWDKNETKYCEAARAKP